VAAGGKNFDEIPPASNTVELQGLDRLDFDWPIFSFEPLMLV
jgi:hypothetical protein